MIYATREDQGIVSAKDREWNPDKAALNWKKHSVGFDEAATVFLDARALTQVDEGHSGEEIRAAVIGYSVKNRMLLVAFTERSGGRIRLVSARAATRMAKDYYADGIRVNCLCPGLFVYAPVHDPLVRPISQPLIRHQPPTARQGEPADLAYAGLYLASDESSFVTGQCFSVDGGDDVKLTGLVMD